MKTPEFGCQVVKACAVLYNFRGPPPLESVGLDDGVILNPQGLESEASSCDDDSEDEECRAPSKPAERKAGLLKRKKIEELIEKSSKRRL
ncbi:MAG: hypothetical protein GY737_06860 [Desulfobacteraceae bacterium]|nr:hypothetical protein [Desulfobacteraceae bacterium]